MSWDSVACNPYEAWFQIYGRLVWYVAQCEMTASFIKELEAHAPKPWVKLSVGFLKEEGMVAIDDVRMA